MAKLTAINLLGSLLLLLARIVLRGLLDRKASLGARGVEVAVVVHGLLERVALPAEDVVTVCSGSANVHRVHEWVGAVGGPESLVGELPHVPHDLVHDLGKLDGVAGWAGAAAVGAGALAVGDVRLVVRGVEVLAVPAAGGVC